MTAGGGTGGAGPSLVQFNGTYLSRGSTVRKRPSARRSSIGSVTPFRHRLGTARTETSSSSPRKKPDFITIFRIRKTPVRGMFALAAVTALLAVGEAAAEPPVPRLVYTKAVTYVKAQARAHHMKVVCDPYSPNGLTARYACTFGTQYQLRMGAMGKCGLAAALYAGPKFTVYYGSRYTLIALCRAGWQAELPLPWALPPA